MVAFSNYLTTKKSHMPCKHLFSAVLVTWSLRLTSTYSQKAYPLDKPVALSFTRLKAFKGPNDVSSSFTWNTKGWGQLVYSLRFSIACFNIFNEDKKKKSNSLKIKK